MPYTYLLIHRETQLRYYGVRYAKNCDPSDLWVTYFTSSKTIHSLIERDGKNAFDFYVRKIFNTADDAIKWEDTVLRRLGVPRNEKYLNIGRNHPASQEQKEQAFMQIYGERWPAHVPELMERARKTKEERYGGTGNSSEVTKEKIIATLEERYGVKSTWEIEGVMEKSMATRKERYGAEWSLQNDEIKEKVKETQFDKFGNWRIALPDVQETVKKTVNERYGVDYVFQDAELMKQVMLNKYGVDNYMKTEEGKSSVRNAWKEREERQCPHCGLSTKSYTSLVRFHNDNCKLKK